MKKLLALLLILLLSFSLVGCSNNDSTENDTANQLEDKLVIYSTHTDEMLELVAEEFKAETGIEVEYINLKGELADRVRAEKENPQADIMFGGASSLFMEMTEEGIFEPVETTWAKDLQDIFKDKDGNWYGTIQTPVMIFYNTEMLTEEEAPKDWIDLTDEKYKDLIVSRDTLSSSMRATLMSLVYQYDKEQKLDEAWNYLTALDANMKNYYSSGTLQFQAVGRKEAAISFAVQSSIVDNVVKNNVPLKIVDAKSGSPVITDGIAAIKNAPHPNAAKAFVEFAGSSKMQAKIANEFNRIPTLKEAIQNSPEWMKDSYKVMDVDWSVISKNQNEWLQKFDTEIRDANKDKAK
ncbi:extracellular solute-binding protein [Sedimentibacter sp. zth1]|uniref:extracellular solute-binding protein n=1 Tax=Sedimentibacter sp. zth1 TaxID=2816908 RepID=UPI001A9381BF|nr:extracellular solute-binding protein [Sedimentibacter sp. zth1]QSX05253.1 extracellular solute-binding protein [Sedimentibacter sp. zth1]